MRLFPHVYLSPDAPAGTATPSTGGGGSSGAPAASGAPSSSPSGAPSGGTTGSPSPSSVPSTSPAAKTSPTADARAAAAKAASSGAPGKPAQTGKIATAKQVVQPSEEGGEQKPTPPLGTPAAAPSPKGKGLESKGFDLSKWDGAIETLPEDSRALAQAIVDRHVGKVKTEFTAKESELAKAREEFEKTGKASWEKKVADLEGDLRIYKALAEGSEDPRVQELSDRVTMAEKSAVSWKQKHDVLQSEQTKAQQAADQKWAIDFKERNKDMLADPARKQSFFNLCEKGGWEEEAAAQLVGQPENVVARAKAIRDELGLSFPGHVSAVKYAKMEAGNVSAPRKPRPAAEVTHGSDGQKTGGRVEGGSVREMNRSDARREAARVALKSVKGGR